MEHELKTWPQFFEAISSGRKTFQVRRNDRGFNAGDTLWLREWKHTLEPGLPESFRYTRNEMRVRVTYVLAGECFGIKDGYCVMGIRRMR